MKQWCILAIAWKSNNGCLLDLRFSAMKVCSLCVEAFLFVCFFVLNKVSQCACTLPPSNPFWQCTCTLLVLETQQNTLVTLGKGKVSSNAPGQVCIERLDSLYQCKIIWCVWNAAANQAFDSQQEPALQQMATAYGLLPRGQQATGQGSSASAPFVQQPQPWSWGQGSSQAGNWGHAGQLSHPGHPQLHGMMSHAGDEGRTEGVSGSTAGGFRQDPASGQVPDALAHLLSAAEAASSVQK